MTKQGTAPGRSDAGHIMVALVVSYYLSSRTAHQHTPDTGNIQASSGLISRMAAEAAAYRR